MLWAVSSDGPIFLVSMCGTPEEFLAAFRRYVDRHGLFIPTATPAPALHSGRFAITLLDGRILVEGDAEVASSSPRPSALYGRTGMTLHFTSVDDASKQTLAALEKAKLSIKVTSQAAGLEPRPSRLGQPVEHPPVKMAGGAADKTLALAECVVVGDLGALSAGRAGKSAAAAAAKAGAKFVIPQIATAGATPGTGAMKAQSQSFPTLDALRTATSTSVNVTPMRSPALDDEKSEATEVGPIVEEGLMQPSGPTLTQPVDVGLAESGAALANDSPLPPEALAAAALARSPLSGQSLDLETTIGGPPPMPPSAPNPALAARGASPAPPASSPAGSAGSAGSSVPAGMTPAVRAPLSPATSQSSAPPPSPAPATTAAAGAPAPAGASVAGPGRQVTSPIAAIASGPISRASTPAIPPAPRASVPVIPPIAPIASAGAPASTMAAPAGLSGPAKRPSSQVIPTIGAPVASPVGSGLSGPAKRPSSHGLGAPASALSGPPSGAVAAPAQRPSSHALRNGTISGPAVGRAPSPPLTEAAAASASPANPVPRMIPAIPSAPVTGAATAAQSRPPVAETNGSSGRSPTTPIRKTVLGIAATYIEPAASSGIAQPIEPIDSAGVPEAVHDSMFEIPDPPDPIPAAESPSAVVAHPGDLRPTQREGLPRPVPGQPPQRQATSAGLPPPPAPPARASVQAMTPPPRPSRPALDAAFDASDQSHAISQRLDGLIETALAATNSGRTASPASSPAGPAGPTAPPPAAPPARPSAGRFGRSSESVAAAKALDDGWGGEDEGASDSGAAPRPMTAPPSQPTVPIRPPSAVPGSGPVRTAAPSPALGVPPAMPAEARSTGSGPSSAAAALAATPSPVDETFATVPTTSPSAPRGPLAAAPSGAVPQAASALSKISGPAVLSRSPHLDAEVTESIDTEDPDDPVFGPVIFTAGTSSPSGAPGAAAPAAPPTAAAAAAFSDTGSVSEPLGAVSASRPQLPAFRPGLPGLSGDASAAPADGGVPAPAALSGPLGAALDPSLRSGPLPGEAALVDDGLETELQPSLANDVDINTDDMADEADEAIAAPPAAPPASAAAAEPAAEPSPAAKKRKRRDDSERLAREHQRALDAKVEIDPALYVESAIDQSFEANFVLPEGATAPASWQEQQQQPMPWDGGAAGIPPVPPSEMPQGYGGYGDPQGAQGPGYPPGYDMAFPTAYHSGDETALVMAPNVGRRRTFVIVGSAFLVVLAGIAIYLYLDRAKRESAPPGPAAATAPVAAAHGDGAAELAPDATEAGASDASDQLTKGDRAGDKTANKTAAAECHVTIDSTPRGATIFAADAQVGVTPFSGTLPCKPVTLTFRKGGFAEATEELTPSPTAKKPFVVTLTAAAAAATSAMVELEIVPNPATAQVKVDDRELGRGPRKLSVPAGVEVTVTITKGGKVATKKFTPTAKDHKLSIAIKRSGRPARKANGPSGNSLDDL